MVLPVESLREGPKQPGPKRRIDPLGGYAAILPWPPVRLVAANLGKV